MTIGRDLPFPIYLSPARSREGTSERHKYLDHFEATYPIMFEQRELFNILVYDSGLRHRDMRNKGKMKREFDTGDIVVVRNQVKSTRKYIMPINYYSKQTDPLYLYRRIQQVHIGCSVFLFGRV